jgi:hypothetical protein
MHRISFSHSGETPGLLATTVLCELEVGPLMQMTHFHPGASEPGRRARGNPNSQHLYGPQSKESYLSAENQKETGPDAPTDATQSGTSRRGCGAACG